MKEPIKFVLRIQNRGLNKFLTKRAKEMGISKNTLIIKLLESYCTCGIEFGNYPLPKKAISLKYRKKK